MKKHVIALSVAAAFGGLAGSATAQTATKLEFNPTGVGHILIVPYFSTQAGSATLLNIYNTDTTNGKAVKVRFRGASNSDDIYDFQVFLSPGDVWTADIRQSASGLSRLATVDKSCTVPASVNGEFITTRLNPDLDGDDLNNETREGYVEILNMGDIPSDSSTKSLYFITKHKDGVAPCTRSILDSLEVSDSRLTNPTTGLMANWTIINVPFTTVYAGAAAAIEARSDAGPGTGANVYWPQQAVAVNAMDMSTLTADPLFVAGLLEAQQYDLPDLSTPYVAPACGASCAIVQANSLSYSMSATLFAGEYLSSATINAATDWVVSKPTRRYYVAVDYEASKASEAIISNYDDNNEQLAVYYTESNVELGNSTNGGKSYQICTQVDGTGWRNREEGVPAPGGPVISPGPREEPPFLCGEVSVLGVNSPTSPTGASVARVNVTLPSGFIDGWGYVSASNGGLGLPVLVQQFSRATNPQVQPGVSGTFGVNYPARVLQRGAAPPLPNS